MVNAVHVCLFVFLHPFLNKIYKCPFIRQKHYEEILAASNASDHGGMDIDHTFHGTLHNRPNMSFVIYNTLLGSGYIILHLICVTFSQNLNATLVYFVKIFSEGFKINVTL